MREVRDDSAQESSMGINEAHIIKLSLPMQKEQKEEEEKLEEVLEAEDQVEDDQSRELAKNLRAQLTRLGFIPAQD